MRLLEPIDHSDKYNIYTRMETRHVVKALCLYDDNYVVLALNDGTHKLPGGGINPKEDPHDALARELLEECGMSQPGKIWLAYHIDEYRTDKYDSSCLFHISTDVYYCEGRGKGGAQRLDTYEQELGMRPVECSLEELPGLFKADGHEWSERDRRIVQAFIEDQQ